MTRRPPEPRTAAPARPAPIPVASLPEVPNVIPFKPRDPTAPPRRNVTASQLAAQSMSMAVTPINGALAMPLPVPEPEAVTAPVIKEPTPAPALPAPQPMLIKPADRWAIFHQLGLGPKKAEKQNAQKLIVSAYRALGFMVLTLIVLVLVGYIITSAFYFVSDSWVQPMVVSRTDERVVALEAQVAQHANERDRIAADLAQADRAIAMQQEFQAEFAKAIRLDLEGRQVALENARELAKKYRGARGKVQRSNSAYASASRKKMQQEYAAGLIDRSDMLSGKYQLAQITTSNLALAEREAEYEQRATELEAEAAALQAILDESGGDGALSYDVLRIKQEYELSRLETAKAIQDREALKAALDRQDALLAGLYSSPYLRAIDEGSNVAFVPYGNLDNVRPGAPLYACKLEMIVCSQVGRVIEVIPGEVSSQHPHREKVMRGQMVTVELTDGGAAEEDVLFVGDKPFFF